MRRKVVRPLSTDGLAQLIFHGKKQLSFPYSWTYFATGAARSSLAYRLAGHGSRTMRTAALGVPALKRGASACAGLSWARRTPRAKPANIPAV